MAVLVLGLAGAAIGSALVPGIIAFGITGASAGWMIGLMLGSMIGPGQHTEGPRVGDRPVTSSTVGSPMSIIYGAARVAGNVVHCSKIREVSTTQTQGKGGPKGSTTTYTYNADIAIDLCAGPIAGIRKMWMDGKLVYDVSTTNTNVGSVMASSAHAQGYLMYPGNETQLPDPTLEALAGVGNVPAYRGRCYVVFQQLDCPFGRIPQLTFEVVTSATGSTPSVLYASVPSVDAGRAAITKDAISAWDVNTEPYTLWDIGAGYARGPKAGGFAVSGNTPSKVIGVQGARAAMRLVYTGLIAAYPVYLYVRTLPGGGMAEIWSGVVGTVDNVPLPEFAAYDAVTGNYCMVSAAGSSSTTRAAKITILPSGLLTDTLLTPGQQMAFYNGVIYTVSYSGGVASLDTYDGGTGVRTGSYPGPTGMSVALVHADAGGVFVLESPNTTGSTDLRCWSVSATGVWTLLTSTARFSNPNGLASTWYCCPTYALVGPCPAGSYSTGSTYLVLPFKAIDSVDPTVAGIILDQCLRAGLTAGQVDVSGITDTVRGYPIHRVSAARDNITPLLKAFFIDAVDVDNKLVFRKRANQLLATTITFDELAAVEGGGAPGDPFPLVRTQETDLPRSLTVQFIDINADYQPGAEQAIRQITSSINDIQEDLAICTDGTQMHQVAEVRLFDMWSARSTRAGKTIRKYAFVCPGDLVTIEYPAGTFGQWLFTSVHDTGLLIEFTAVEANAALYQSAAAGAVTSLNQTVDPLPTPTHLLFADIPLLRDVDNYPGAYVALAGLGSAWPGATLYTGLDAGSLIAKGTVTAAAPIGFVENALGDWPLNQIDETNLLTVNVGPDTLTSTTRDRVVAGTDNLCMVGAPGRWEIVQYTRAAALGNGRFTLSGFKRGMLGTEQYRGTHLVTDTFCRLTIAGVLKPHVSLVELNTAKHYQAITTGMVSGAASDEVDIDTGVCLKPLSPIDVRSSLSGGGDVVFTFGRRTRLSANWLAGVVPLGEQSEQYELDILRAGAVVRTLKGTITSTTYLVADQYADFGNAASTQSAKVYQISASVGRGFGTPITFALAANTITGGSGFPGSTPPPGGTTVASLPELHCAFKTNGKTIAFAQAFYGATAAYKLFESDDDGATFHQLPGASAQMTRYGRLRSALPGGIYVSVPGEAINNYNVTKVFVTKGVAGTVPSLTATSFARPYMPVAISNDGTKFVLITEGNQVYHSTDGVAWTLQGTTSGLPSFFSVLDASSGTLAKNYGDPYLSRAASGRWFMGTPSGVYWTATGSALSGWTKCVTPSGQFISGRVVNAGAKLFCAGGANNATTGNQDAIVLESSDDGANWTQTAAAGIVNGNTLLMVGSRLAIVSQTFNKTTTYSADNGTTWTTAANSVVSIWSQNHVVCGANILVETSRYPRADSEPNEQLQYSAAALAFTNCAGV
jgi:hypothetical protein